MQEEEEKNKALEAEEVIYLRWTNACLKNELMRRSQQHDIEEHENCGGNEEFGSENELNQRAVEENGSYFGSTAQDHARDRSKRRRLIAKFKKWVEGSDKCLPRNSASDGVEEDSCLVARKSCSSV